ncbi:site-specific integrase (plasmid) [Halorarum halophilum]|uniref:Site-specific integrase n=1 Tax=Halorarum halophilum TaxID=2743090 RepID=A0A7D5GEJ9_9EURY|nr:site-specific integrase [Halobaculum halophilum]QLG29886.1 site-specific integrase [Halobaculum halophilum]
MSYRWTTKNLDDLEQFYYTEVEPALQADGLDSATERPTYTWMVEHGFSGFIKALRRDHGLTPTEFYDRIDVGTTEAEDEYWGIEHDLVRNLLSSYIDELLNRRGHPETTVYPLRSRLKKYVQVYAEVNETADFVAPLRDEAERPAEIDRALAVFDILNEVLGTPASKFKYLEDTRRFYKHLIRSGHALYNPLAEMEKRFGWDRPEWDNPALTRDQIQALYAAAETPEERFIVVGLAGWGIRPSELCALHTRQLVLAPVDDDHPYIRFTDGERKNGPGTVSLLAGLDNLKARIDALADDSEWNGYLFPSSTATAGHLTTGTLRRWFADIAVRADVTVAGSAPTPKLCRRFWYSLYGEVVRDLAEQFEPIAADQGSTSADVVLSNYLSEAERRSHRRAAMDSTLSTLFVEG